MVDQYSAEELQKAGRIKQILMVGKLVNQQNKRALPIVFGAAVLLIVVCVLIGLLTGLTALLAPLGVLLGAIAAMILFGRFAQQAQYSAIDGQMGAAAAVMQSMPGDWNVTPAVAGNRTMDVVHRAVGRGGVVLVGEGVPTRVAALLASERKKTERVAHGVPVHEFQVGSGEGQIPVSKLQRKITTLPRVLKPTAVSDLNYRLRALQPSMQMPKGPLPKGARQPRMPKPR
ncbi:MAG TPA: DUF4191 domain-containing protein [Trebonia sp.]